MKNFIFIIFALLTLNLVAQDCKDIDKKTDKFTGRISFRSPLKYYLRYSKIIDTDSSISYYLFLTNSGYTLTGSGKGVILLLEDSTKLEFPDASIDYLSMVMVGSSVYYTYTAMLSLSQTNLEKLSKSCIVDYRLYIFDAKVRKKHKEKFRNYLNCLLLLN